MRTALVAVAALLALAAPAAAQAPPVVTVAGAGEVTRAQFDHWMRVAARVGVPRPARRGEVMKLLVQSLWVRGEAAQRGIVVSGEELRRAFAVQKRRSFPRPGDFGRFLRRSGFRLSDILFRVRLELLSLRIRRQVVRAAPAVTEEEERAYYEEHPRDFVVPERRDVRYAVAARRAAALAKPRRLRVYARRGDFPPAVFRRRHGVVRWRGVWLAFRVVRVHPRRTETFAQARERIHASLTAERQQDALEGFIREFRERWRALTTCRAAYATDAYCGQTTS